MHNFNISLVANISFKDVVLPPVMELDFKEILLKDRIYSLRYDNLYSEDLIRISFKRIKGKEMKNLQGYKENEYLYSIVVTGSARGRSSLELGQKLKHTLDAFTKSFASSSFLYSLYIDRADKKDFCVISSQYGGI